ncbi:MAG: hypothetical protein WKF96_03080 [Solirubrobacteraceae bacterium]
MAGACYDPAVCRSCRRVVGAQVTATVEEAQAWANAGKKPRHAKQAAAPESPFAFAPVELEPRCPDCTGPVEPWGTSGEAESTEEGPCPQCGGTAHAEDVGMWD